MKKEILVVEDDLSLGETISERLSKHGYAIEWLRTQQKAESRLAEKHFDLIILDVGLLEGNGFDLAENIKSKVLTPIIFMTALNTAEDRLKAYELGGEEFIPKPFHLKELLLRVQHVLANHSVRESLKVGETQIDFESMSIVNAQGRKQFVPQRDFLLLECLINAAPKAVSREDILNKIWGENCFPTNRTIDNSIVRLRGLLENKDIIRTVRAVGYQWNAQGVTHG